MVREVNSQFCIWLEVTLHSHHIDPVIGAEFDNLESIKRAVALSCCLAVLSPIMNAFLLELRSIYPAPKTLVEPMRH